jgi:hypothetical protein
MNAQIQYAPGNLLLDIPADVYHARELGVASTSVLKMLLQKSPAHYRAWLDSKDEHETPALAFGRAYHCRVLEPERFAREFLVMPSFGDMRSSTNRAKRDAWLAEHPGVQVISDEDNDRIAAMHAALMANPVAAGIFADGHPEVTMYWRDEQTGIGCKARADWWRPGMLFADLKTTDDASPEGFARSVVKYGYHIQHAHYADGANACGERIPNFLIVAQEKEAPYVCQVYQIDAAAEVRGFELRERGLQILDRCVRTNTFPGYRTGITELALPNWALKD